jgi:hypothetical protein
VDGFGMWKREKENMSNYCVEGMELVGALHAVNNHRRESLDHVCRDNGSGYTTKMFSDLQPEKLVSRSTFCARKDFFKCNFYVLENFRLLYIVGRLCKHKRPIGMQPCDAALSRSCAFCDEN